MNNHNNHLPDYREIMKYEGKIVELFNHNVHKYKYVGEEGKEYEVIQSVFNEINHLPGLSNKHIRWYAIIINLRMSFQNRRMAAKLILPPYMGLIDLYVNEIARLGMLVCTKEKINPGYLDYKLEKIHSLLAELLKEMDTQRREKTREEVFILTIKNAANNAKKLGKTLLNHREKSFAGINWEVYQRLIGKRIQHIDEKRLARYNNMEAFWNGFIP
jgi:hypothetical protein